jgi:4'-phosphopantetheinyl transferase
MIMAPAGRDPLRVGLRRFDLAAPIPAGVLDRAERERAERMRVGGRRWAAARARLRLALAEALDADPASLGFSAGPNGKPSLAGRHSALRFSLAHSGDVALLATRWGHDVGVDVEHVRDDVDAAAVARAVFTPRERAAMAALDEACPQAAFFRTWVHREAFAKATGAGVALPAEHEVAGWTVREVRGIPGCAAAVASVGSDWTVTWSAGPATLQAAPEPLAASPRPVTR